MRDIHAINTDNVHASLACDHGVAVKMWNAMHALSVAVAAGEIARVPAVQQVLDAHSAWRDKAFPQRGYVPEGRKVA